MPDAITYYVGDRNPSITETLTVAGAAVDLTSSTVRFKAREPGTTALLVDAAATIVTAAAGTVRYDWTAADAATGALSVARQLLIWWEETAGGKVRTMNEAVITVAAHAPQTNAYVELEEFKRTAELTGTTYADQNIRGALVAASRGIDKAFHRRFYLDPSATSVRYYTPNGASALRIDDLVVLTSLKSDNDGSGTFETTWVANTDFVLEPLNAAADGRPYERIRLHPNSSLYLPAYPRSVEVTGQFGWPAVPEEVKVATSLIASRLVKRTREAPFGIVGLGLDGAAVRAASIARDPEFAFLRDAVERTQVLG